MSEKHTEKNFPKLQPWYVLIVTGLTLTGFFPWLMVSQALYQRGKTYAAIGLFCTNFAIFIFLSWFLLKTRLVWWQLMCLVYLFNLVWAVGAWLFQRKAIGPSPRRYILAEWKSWIIPLLVGVIIGVCMATVFSIPTAMGNRYAMKKSADTLDRETVLTDFFQHSFLGLAAGLIAGLWWAGEHRRFRTSHVITFLSAFTLTISFWIVLGLAFIFFINKGISTGYLSDSSSWAVIPPWGTGFRKYLFQIQSSDISGLIVIPLLFGAVSRVRDFGVRVILIPLTFLCALPMDFASHDLWEIVQPQIIYEMSSPDTQTRASAHEWAEIMLKRYPDHQGWPKIAEDLSRYYYQKGRHDKSEALSREIIDRYSNSNQWYWTVFTARAFLGSPDFGKPCSGPRLDIPMVDYEEYLTRNWMALLSVIRYWEGPDIPESKVKIRLKYLSKSDSKILLNPLESLADLDDAARSLGYGVLILPADLAETRALILSEIPVIHQFYNVFNVIFGFDESRSSASAYTFFNLSARLRKESRKEAREILSIEEEGHGRSKNRLARIANETEDDYPFDYWKDPALKYTGPLSAIVFPTEKTDTIAASLNMSPDALKKKSNGFLAALIGLSYLKNADLVHAVEWAKISAEKITDPLPMYVAHLAKVFWESRNKKVRTRLRLEDQFPELKRITACFNEPGNAAFLESARLRFEADLDANIIPWMILSLYVPKLDKSNPAELDQMIKIMQGCLSVNPHNYYWLTLSKTYEWAGNISGMVDALKGAVSYKPMSSKLKLRLAYGYVLLGKYSDAKAILNKTDSDAVRYDADYLFCLGAIAENEGDVKGALKKYKQAIDMRRYKPVYHLRYGKLLLRKGMTGEAEKALEWAARTDAGGPVKNEAKKLLSEIRQ